MKTNYSELINQRITQLKHWHKAPGTSKSFFDVKSAGKSFRFNTHQEKITLFDACELEALEMALIDLIVDFLNYEQRDYREFLFYLRDQNSVAAFEEEKYPFVRYAFNFFNHEFQNRGIAKQSALEGLNKVERVLVLEKALEKIARDIYQNKINIELLDLDGKLLVLNLKCSGDEQLYLERIQESLVDIFQDFELNCITEN
jgi:hypothetical protein